MNELKYNKTFRKAYETRYTVPDHQFLLSFDNDEDCWTFEQWFEEHGAKLFELYLEEL